MIRGRLKAPEGGIRPVNLQEHLGQEEHGVTSGKRNEARRLATSKKVVDPSVAKSSQMHPAFVKDLQLRRGRELR